MKIVEFFLIIWGKLSELEPEFLTSWSQSRSQSWSRTKKDRLPNTEQTDEIMGMSLKKTLRAPVLAIQKSVFFFIPLKKH
jgi:hypothetical protein